MSVVVLTRSLKHGQQLTHVITHPLHSKLLLILKMLLHRLSRSLLLTPITICNPTPAQVSAAFGNATASDNCGPVTPTGVLGSETLVSGCTYQVIKTWTATDACNNSSTAQQAVTYTKDVTAPVITIAPITPITICNPTPAQVSAAFGNATASDNCGPVTPTVYGSAETLVSGCTYQVIKTWTATDACNNSSTAQQAVTYTKDVTAPVITIAPITPITICNPTPAQVSAAFGNATASDNCGPVTPRVLEMLKLLSAVVLTRSLKHGQQLTHVITHPLHSKLLLILKMLLHR